MAILNKKGMELLEKIQDKYKFMNLFALEDTDVYAFCTRIKEAYKIGLCMDEEDIHFIDEVLERYSK